MTSQENKLTLEELLNTMTTLDKNVYTPDERAAIEASNDRVDYNELLSHDLAKAILGKDYDPECSYKLLTEVTQTTVLKIDPRIPEDEEPVVDANGAVVRAHVMEYTLQEYVPDNCKVDLERTEDVIRDWCTVPQQKTRVKLDWRVVFAVVLILLVIAWCVTFNFLLSIKVTG